MANPRAPERVADVTKGFNPYLHGARGLFAFMIVLFHIVNSGLPTFSGLSEGWPLFLMRSLEHGVELFFGVSGIVIVGALSRARGPGLFLAERATRIYPVLWATIVVILLLSAVSGFEGRRVPDVGAVVANLLAFPPLLPGLLIHPAAWSLSYELCFYGFCALAWSVRRLLKRWAIPIIFAAAACLIIYHVRAILMPVGLAVGYILAKRPQWWRAIAAPGICLFLFLTLWELLCEANHGDLMGITGFDLLRGYNGPIAVLAVVAGTATFVGILRGQGWLSQVLSSRILQFLGTVSYSLYLWHPIVMSISKHCMYVLHVPQFVGPFSQLTFLALALPPSLIIAWASQLTLEKRVTTWLRGILEPGRKARHEVLTPETVNHEASQKAIITSSL